MHSIRDIDGGILGLIGGRGADDEYPRNGLWEATAEAWISHEGAVTGIDMVKGYDNGRGDASGFLTSGGDG